MGDYKKGLINPKDYPGENITEIPNWIINVTYPVTTEELIEKYGDDEVIDNEKETKSLSEILSRYPGRQFNSYNELMAAIYYSGETNYNI
ncbi:MAG: hypothetical protein ACD_20C00104G0005 [uncultured bacterium]|nr:MAG: hypothetical protein ACD_20C00104G0005 [uncultured bacterium]HBH18873.1 hypothetical protein [Cyanobacteria bacterium UBA9579]